MQRLNSVEKPPNQLFKGFSCNEFTIGVLLNPMYCTLLWNGSKRGTARKPPNIQSHRNWGSRMTGPQKNIPIKSNTWVNLRRLVSPDPANLGPYGFSHATTRLPGEKCLSSTPWGSRLLHGCSVGDLFCSLSIFQGPPGRHNDFSQRPKPCRAPM